MEGLKRLCRDTAIDMKGDKMYFAGERRVWWTIYVVQQLGEDSAGTKILGNRRIWKGLYSFVLT